MVIQDSLCLFIYGTLHPDFAPADIAATANRLLPIGKATVQGRRYELGEYPGVVLGSGPADTVTGEVFLLPEGPEALEVLARLDAYEDYRPNDPEGSLFVRELTNVTMEDGSRRQCWIYTYNHSVGECRQKT